MRPDIEIHEIITSDRTRRRDGFRLTDSRAGTRSITGEIEYCTICHERGQRFMLNRKWKKKRENIKTVGIEIKGCPLMKNIGNACPKRKWVCSRYLAMVMLDNPNVQAQGHRICNDCMKGCIFQNRLVNIPVYGNIWSRQMYSTCPGTWNLRFWRAGIHWMSIGRCIAL